MTDPVAIARQVLAADGHPFSTLSLAPSMAVVTIDTPVPEARRNYMRLAGLIHPDKIKGAYDEATDAFQCLVRAFESFADPKRRRAAAAADAKQRVQRAKAAPVATEGASRRGARVSAAREERRKTPGKGPVPKQRRAKARRDADNESDDSEGSSESEDESASEASHSDADEEAEDREPIVSDSRTLIGKPRIGGLCVETTIGCPNCRTRWEPDARPQYSLFMGPWGKRVHCQLCLFVFGSATALHACPHCTAPFEYDSSMYEDTVTCSRCQKKFGFPYYPITQRLVDQIRLEEWRARRERERASEREARMRARNGGGTEADAAAERFSLLLGTCVMDDACPLCHQRVRSKHRAHVESCVQREKAGGPAVGAAVEKPLAAKTSPRKPAAKRGARAASGGSLSASKAASPVVSAKKPAAKRAAAAKPKPKACRRAGKKRRRGSDDDSDDDSEESDDSEEDSFSSGASESEASSSESENDDGDDDDSDD